MEEISIVQVEGKFMQMNAPEGFYITQNQNVDTLERLYVRRRILLTSESVTDWRVADENEMLHHNNLLKHD